MTSANRKWWTLAAVSIGLFMVMLDNTVVNVALPTIGRKLPRTCRHWSARRRQAAAAQAESVAAVDLTGGRRRPAIAGPGMSRRPREDLAAAPVR